MSTVAQLVGDFGGYFSVAAVFAELAIVFVLRATRFVVAFGAFVALMIMLVVAFAANKFGIIAVVVLESFFVDRTADVRRLNPHAEFHGTSAKYLPKSKQCAPSSSSMSTEFVVTVADVASFKARDVRGEFFGLVVVYAGELFVAHFAHLAETFGFGCVEVNQHVELTRRFEFARSGVIIVKSRLPIFM